MCFPNLCISGIFSLCFCCDRFLHIWVKLSRLMYLEQMSPYALAYFCSYKLGFLDLHILGTFDMYFHRDGFLLMWVRFSLLICLRFISPMLPPWRVSFYAGWVFLTHMFRAHLTCVSIVMDFFLR